MSERKLVAYIGHPHGVKGSVFLRPLIADFFAVRPVPTLYREDGSKFPPLVILGSKKDKIIVAIEGITDRTQVELLKGLSLFADIQDLQPLACDEYYLSDICGLTAIDSKNNVVIGKVSNVVNYGAGDIVEITNQQNVLHLYPFTEDFVPQIDMARRVMLVNVPDIV
jgi:16S rRNA processing protein RimM